MEEKIAFKIGDFVKIRVPGEAFWCILTGLHDDGTWQAKVNNELVTGAYKLHEEIRIKPEEILDWMDGDPLGDIAFEKAKKYASETEFVCNLGGGDPKATIFNLRSFAYAAGYKQAIQDLKESNEVKENYDS